MTIDITEGGERLTCEALTGEGCDPSGVCRAWRQGRRTYTVGVVGAVAVTSEVGTVL